MGANRVAVVGVGQTKYAAVRGDVSLPGLLREAAYRALADAHMTMDDIDAVVVGKAPDFFEGIMMPETYLAEALGAVGKPLFRVHTAGSVGGSTAIVAATHVESGVHERVLTIGWEQQSVSEAMWALSFPIPFQQQLVAGAGGYFAPFIREYMRRSERSRRHRHPGGAEGPAERAEEPVRAPPRARHHLRLGQGVVHAVGADPLLRDLPVAPTAPSPWCSPASRPPRRRPRRRACRRRGSTARRCAPSPPRPSGRDQVSPAGRQGLRGRRVRAGRHHQPARSRSTSSRCTCRSPGTSRCGSRTSGFAPEGEGWKLTESGVTQMDGDLPVNCSGGVLSTNPIGASGMIRFGEAAMQVRGTGRRPPDRRRPRRPRPRLRRRRPVLRHVGRGRDKP